MTLQRQRSWSDQEFMDMMIALEGAVRQIIRRRVKAVDLMPLLGVTESNIQHYMNGASQPRRHVNIARFQWVMDMMVAKTVPCPAQWRNAAEDTKALDAAWDLHWQQMQREQAAAANAAARAKSNDASTSSTAQDSRLRIRRISRVVDQLGEQLDRFEAMVDRRLSGLEVSFNLIAKEWEGKPRGQ